MNPTGPRRRNWQSKRSLCWWKAAQLHIGSSMQALSRRGRWTATVQVSNTQPMADVTAFLARTVPPSAGAARPQFRNAKTSWQAKHGPDGTSFAAEPGRCRRFSAFPSSRLLPSLRATRGDLLANPSEHNNRLGRVSPCVSDAFVLGSQHDNGRANSRTTYHPRLCRHVLVALKIPKARTALSRWHSSPDVCNVDREDARRPRKVPRPYPLRIAAIHYGFCHSPAI